jgi:hypothetical protein
VADDAVVDVGHTVGGDHQPGLFQLGGFVLGLLGWMLDGLDDEGRAHVLNALRRTTAAHPTNSGVVYRSAAWIIRAMRR